MTDLSTDEQRYLLAAFAASRHDWFLPRTVDARYFSDRQSDRIVESLVRRGLLQAQPEQHARLTDGGRREAAQLGRLAARDWRKFYRRRRTTIEIALAVTALSCVLIVLRWTGLL
jgi:Mn-dependent DtxR family transcriptional regulator